MFYQILISLRVLRSRLTCLFATNQFITQGFATLFRRNRTSNGGEIVVYIWDDIPAKLLNISFVSSDKNCFEITLLKIKWFLICSYHPLKISISNH